MQKLLTWYQLLLKRSVKKKITWFMIVGMVLLVIIYMNTKVPDSNNIRVGITKSDSKYATRMIEILQEKESVFTFETYANSEEMDQDVISGKIIGGFIFDEDFDEKIENEKTDKSVTYITTPLEMKGETVKETFYTAFLECYSDVILAECEIEIYGDHDESRMEDVLNKFQGYLNGEEIFQVDKVIQKGESTSELTVKENTYEIQGMIGLMILLLMFLSTSSGYDTTGKAFMKALEPKERTVYRYLNQLAAGTPLAIVGYFMIIFQEQSRGAMKELLLMIVLLVVGGIWNILITCLIRSESGMVAGILILVIVNLILCPVIIDLGQWIPAIAYIRIIFPLGIYL